MGIYRLNLAAIVIGGNLSPIIVIAQNKFDLSITDIAFVNISLSPINYRDTRFLCTQCFNFKVSALALWKKYTVSIKTCCNFKKLSLCFV